MGINRGRNIIRSFIIIQMFRITAADSSSDPPPLLAALVSIAPCVGILTIIFYFCCHRYQKYSRKFFRFTSLANWIIFGVSMVLCLFDFEGIEINFFDGVTISECVIVVAIILSWSVVIVESYTCRERQYIKQIMDRNSAVRKIKELMEKEPEIKWMARGCVSSGILCLPFEKSKVQLSLCKLLSYHESEQWRIYIVKFWTRPPPCGSKFFQFHAVFGEIWQNRMLVPPGELAPPPRGNPGSATGEHK